MSEIHNSRCCDCGADITILDGIEVETYDVDLEHECITFCISVPGVHRGRVKLPFKR